MNTTKNTKIASRINAGDKIRHGGEFFTVVSNTESAMTDAAGRPCRFIRVGDDEGLMVKASSLVEMAA